MKVLFLISLFVLGSCVGEELTEEQKIMKTLDDDTLLGPDKNNDGVRDDVEYWINQNIKGKDLKYAVMMYAKYKRESIRFVDNRKKSNEMGHLRRAYGDCIYWLSSLNSSRWIVETLAGKMHNSKDRMSAFTKAQHNFAGESGVSPNSVKEACPFELSRSKDD